MSEPLRWCVRFGEHVDPAGVIGALRSASRGPSADEWSPPPWLLPHQPDAARRVAARLEIFRGALLADAVGLGKTFVALAVATRYRHPAVLAPPQLVSQWRRAAAKVGMSLAIQSDYSLSHGHAAPSADLLIVDEAHRFRKSGTRRYHALAVRPATTALLLLTATPVVNGASDLVSLLELFLADNGLAVLGVPSLRQAAGRREYAQLAHAASAVMVARSPAVLEGPGAFPCASDSAVVSLPTLEVSAHREVMELIGRLRFPAFDDRSAAALLALHLRYRLASSAAACLETLRRHVTYLERAVEASQRGEHISRHEARALFGGDDVLQLSLGLMSGREAAPVDARDLSEERDRIEGVVRRLQVAGFENPKALHLERVLAGRGGRKTIVFTTAVATANDLARRLRWHRAAVVSARGAWIASGPLPSEEALGLFAPAARGAPLPSASRRVDTLIATDLVGEGLDLQDADAIVHYDLPWTPLRLEQRLGRIARLGSPHRSVSVWWFKPPLDLESDLGLSGRIAAKAGRQLVLGVPVSSAVGRAQILGESFRWQEQFEAGGPPETLRGPCYALVAGPRAAILILQWTTGSGTVPEVLVLEDGEPVLNQDRRSWLMQALVGAPSSEAELPCEILPRVFDLIRNRLSTIDRPATDDRSVRLSRLVLQRAATAARRREPRLLARLDQVLDRVLAGVTEGARRRLQSLMEGSRCDQANVCRWLDHYPGTAGVPTVRLVAALLGLGP